MLPLRAQGRSPSQPLPAPGGAGSRWLVPVLLQSPHGGPAFVSLCIFPWSSYLFILGGHQSFDFGPTPIQCDFILIISAKSWFPNKITCWGGEWTWILERYYSAHDSGEGSSIEGGKKGFFLAVLSVVFVFSHSFLGLGKVALSIHTYLYTPVLKIFIFFFSSESHVMGNSSKRTIELWMFAVQSWGKLKI